MSDQTRRADSDKLTTHPDVFAGVEPYYQRLFKQIVERHNPLGTGGDMDCLISMVEYLWKREQAQSATLEERTRELEEAKRQINVVSMKEFLDLKHALTSAIDAQRVRAETAEATLTRERIELGGEAEAEKLRRICAREMEAALTNAESPKG